MPDQNPNPPATVPAQREAVGPVKKSTPVVIALIAIVALVGIANISSLVRGKKKSAPQSALPMRPATASPQQVSGFETQQQTEAKRDSDDRQRQQELAAEMQQLQASQSIPGPEAAGIVRSVDAHANTLTIATLDGNEASYNPALLKKQTGQSAVYREEQRDLAAGERITFTVSDRDAHIRFGDLATLERTNDNNTLSVRLDNGKSVELTSDQARHIEYGYAVETLQRASLDRVLVTGESPQLARQEKMFTHLSPYVRELTIYISDSRDPAVKKAMPRTEIGLTQDGISPATESISMPSAPTIEVEGLGIGI